MATKGSSSTLVFEDWKIFVGDRRFYLDFEWERTSYSVTNNTSTIHCVVTLRNENYALDLDQSHHSLYIKSPANSKAINNSFDEPLLKMGKNSSLKIIDTNVTIPHLSGGAETVCTYNITSCEHNNIDTTEFFVQTPNLTFTLDAIPQFATILTAPNFTDDDNPEITYSNPSGTAVTTLQACIADSAGTTIYAAYRNIGKTSDSYTFNLTAAERAALRQAVATVSSLQVRFYIKTVVNGETKLVSLLRTMSVDDAAPTLNPVVKDTNSTTLALTGNESILIPGYSNAYYSIGATAHKGASIQSQSVTCGAIVQTTATGTFTAVPNYEFTFYCRDTRGSMVYQSYEADYVPYFKVTCNQTVRLNLDGTADLEITGNYFDGSFGKVSNTLSVQVRHREDGGAWGSWATLDPLISEISGGSYRLTATISGYDPSGTHEFQARAIDKLHTALSGEDSIVLTPIFDWSRNDFNFNVPVKMNGETVLRHNETANNLVVSASGGFIYMRPGGTNDTTSEVLITPQGNIQLSGDIIINGKSLKSLLGIE